MLFFYYNSILENTHQRNGAVLVTNDNKLTSELQQKISETLVNDKSISLIEFEYLHKVKN